MKASIKKPEYMTIDGMPVEIGDEKNLLELIRKAGIKLPTFCYHSELSIYGACRMCMVENERGGLEAACSARPRAGMVIRTNTERLRRYRRVNLELILASHCRDCTTCEKSGNCKLQELAARFHIDGVRFPSGVKKPEKDSSSLCIVKDNSKCILCGDCVRMCNEVQSVGAIDFAHRGSKMTVSTAFGVPLSESGCVGCGQCAAVCPTGAIVIKSDVERLWKDLSDREAKLVVQIAPAVRVAVGKEFGLPEGESTMGLIVAALRRMGFDEVFDTATGADLTVLEEANELLRRIEEGGHDMPLFTSCCPAWVNYCEKYHPELLPNISTCKSPMQMFAAVVKQQYASSSRRLVNVAIMPCTAKKFEAAREEFRMEGKADVDYVITTQELIRMIRESGIVFSELEPEAVDAPLGYASGAGVIFGVTGGVTEAVLRRVASDKSKTALQAIPLYNLRGMAGVKEATVLYGNNVPYGDNVPDGGRELHIAIVSGLKNASELIKRIKTGEHFDFVEVMACPGGCVSGAGQPYVSEPHKALRGKGLYASDKLTSTRRSEENPLMMSLYNGLLKGRVHELLHVEYSQAEKETNNG